MPIDDMTTDSLSEASAAISEFSRALPPALRDEGRALARHVQAATSAASQTFASVEAIDDPAPDAPALADPLTARRDAVTAGETGVREALTAFDEGIERLGDRLRAEALPPAPSGVAAQVARDEIRQVLGEARGPDAVRRLARLARSSDPDVAGALLSSWGLALAESVGLDRAAVLGLESSVLISAAGGAFGGKHQGPAQALGSWGKALEARTKAGAAAAALGRLGRRRG